MSHAVVYIVLCFAQTETEVHAVAKSVIRSTVGKLTPIARAIA